MLLELTFVDHTCTCPMDKPPVTEAVNVCAAVASIVSMTVLQAPLPGARRLT